MRGFIDHDSDGNLEILADNISSGERAVWAVSDSEATDFNCFPHSGLKLADVRF